MLFISAPHILHNLDKPHGIWRIFALPLPPLSREFIIFFSRARRTDDLLMAVCVTIAIVLTPTHDKLSASKAQFPFVVYLKTSFHCEWLSLLRNVRAPERKSIENEEWAPFIRFPRKSITWRNTFSSMFTKLTSFQCMRRRLGQEVVVYNSNEFFKLSMSKAVERTIFEV